MLTSYSINTCKNINLKNTWRERNPVEFRRSSYIKLKGKIYCNFTSNDYLNLSQHSEVKRSFKKAINIYGLGSGASPLVSGYHHPHQQFEEAFADFLGRDKALLFNSGYHANLAIFQSLINRHGVIFSDKYCHASLLDGIQLSRAKHVRFRHKDSDILQQYLNREKIKEKILITESVFSMQGDIANLSELSRICQEHHVFFCLDDAHGLGVLGTSGRGACEHFNLSQQSVPCLIHPLGKVLGSMGAMISGSYELIETLIQNSRTYRYSTALPPAVASASLTALTILKSEFWRRIQLHENIIFFNKLAQSHQFPLCSWDLTPIRSIVIGSNVHALQLQEYLLNKGHFVSCIRPPTVPENTARLRISLCCEHSQENILMLMNDLADVFLQKR